MGAFIKTGECVCLDGGGCLSRWKKVFVLMNGGDCLDEKMIFAD